MEYTLSIIKPDATKRNLIGKIITKFEEENLKVVALKMQQLTQEQAQAFYNAHKDRSFFKELVDFMTSGPVVIQVLAGKDAVTKNRSIMGATNPSDANAGTIRAEFAESIEANSVHGSDSKEAAEEEIKFFFSDDEIVKL